jgi:hypothetical protein
MLYRRLRQAGDATAFISACRALAIVAFAVYAGLRIAVLAVERMAQLCH